MEFCEDYSFKKAVPFDIIADPMFSIRIFLIKIHITPSAPKRYCSFVVWCVVAQGADKAVSLKCSFWKIGLIITFGRLLVEKGIPDDKDQAGKEK